MQGDGWSSPHSKFNFYGLESVSVLTPQLHGRERFIFLSVTGFVSLCLPWPLMVAVGSSQVLSLYFLPY